ncbi:MAG: electron transport complex subunit RsxE [Bacilli bacterium]|nr:electron transport complex subunit RsxE [Bacilli bacterium]
MSDEIARNRHKESFLSGIIKQNPLFVAILGMCPALAVTKTFEASFGMGLLFTFVLVCSNVIVSLLRKVVPEEIETPAHIVIIATFVTIVKMLTNALLPELYSSLGVFLSLLVVNCIVLGRSESFAKKNTVFDSFLDGVGNGIGYTLAISIIGIIREILGKGSLTVGKIFTFISYNGSPITIPILKNSVFDVSMGKIFSNPAGGFIVMGILLAIIAAVVNYNKAKKKAAAKSAAKPAPNTNLGGAK